MISYMGIGRAVKNIFESKNKTLPVLMLSIALTMVLTQSATAEEGLVSATIGEQFQLKVNQIANLQSDNIKIKFLNVTEDSRCPSDVECGWQGQASVTININQDGQDLGNFKLTSVGGEEQKAIRKFIGEQIKLVEVSPYPTSTKTIQLSDYVATFVVSDTTDRTIIITDGSSKAGCEKIKTCYFPYSITVKQDTQVTWINMDSESHTVTSGNIKDGQDGIFSSELIAPGESFSHKFTVMKPQDYYCMIHPWMVGSVIVEFSAFDPDKKIITVEQALIDKSLTVEVEATEPTAYEELGIHAYFRNSTQSLITDINYDIEVTQNLAPVLVLKEQYSHTGISEHWTKPLRSNSPVDVKVTVLGIGLPGDESNWSGPKGEVVTFSAVPEFPIAGLILVASMMTILIVTRTKWNKI